MTAQLITPHVRQITAPTALRDLPGWLMWRYEHRPGDAKARKVPYYTDGARRHGIQGRPEDLARLCTFDVALLAAAKRGMDGVGFCPQTGWGICALDFDHCVSQGSVDPLIESLVTGTYAEFSPSGTGVRAFVRADLGNGKSITGEAFGLELFSSKGFVTFTGNTLPVCEMLESEDHIADASRELHALVEQRFPHHERVASSAAPLGVDPSLIDAALAALPDDLSYDEWVQVGMAIHHETSGDGFDLWDNWSAQSPKYADRDYGLERWESFGRHDGTPVTLRTLVHMANLRGAALSLSEPLDPSSFEDLSVPEPDTAGHVPDTSAEAPLKFPTYSAAEVSHRNPLGYWIKGVIPQGDIGLIYGESGSGKSFVTLDMLMSLARGVAWDGRRVKPARCLYVAAEGAAGLRGRIAAYCEHNDIDPGDITLRVMTDAPNILKAEHILELVRSVEAMGGCDIITLDTLAQVTPGSNENTSEDMGRALAHCRELRKRTQAMVWLVHHAGKDVSRGARGWSGIKGALDFEIEITRDTDVRAMRLTKLKDGIDGLRWGFRLETVQVGEDDDGDPVTSCHVAYTEAPAAMQINRTPKRGAVQSLVVRAVETLAAVTAPGPEYNDLVAHCVTQMPLDETAKRDQRTSHVKRAIDVLVDAKVLVIENMVVRVV